MAPSSLCCALALACAAAPTANAQALTIFAGAGTGDVLVANDAGFLPTGQVAALQDVRLLGLDFTLHSPLDAYDAGLPQTFALPDGQTALRVPGQGAVYAFERVEAERTVFGLFRVRLDGHPELLLELEGTGPLKGTHPFARRVAIAPANDALLIATTMAAGGDLLELDLATLGVTDHTAGLPPFDFGPVAGLALTHGHGFAATGSELVRFDRAGLTATGTVALQAPGGPAVWVPGDFARSGDGLGLALVAGGGPADEYVFVIDGAGQVQRVTDVGAPISGGGYLPDAPHGPFFALSLDATHVAWRTELPLSTEGWLQATGVTTAASLTDDSLFLDTLDEIAPFAFFDGKRLLMGVGELDGPVTEGTDATDLFAVTLDPTGAPQFTNLTLSSGDATAPFFSKPAISPEAVRRLPGTDRYLIHDGKQHELLVVGGGLPPVQLEPTAKQVRFELASGDRLLLAIERDDPFKDLRVVVLDLANLTAQTLTIMSKETEVRTSAARGDGWVGLTIQAGLNQWTLGLNLQTGFAQATLPVPFGAGPMLDIDANGDLLLSSAMAPALFARDRMPGPPSLIGTPPTVGFILPR